MSKTKTGSPENAIVGPIWKYRYMYSEAMVS